jgi:hypothetical protein
MIRTPASTILRTLFSHRICCWNELKQTPNCGMTSCRVREEPWKSQSVCTTSPTMVSPKLAVQFCNPHQLTSHRFKFQKHVLPHHTPFNVCQLTQLEKPWDVFRTPSSNCKQSLQHIQAIAMEKSNLLLHHNVDAKSAYQFYFSIFLQSITYSFSTNTIPEGPLTTAQNASVRPILSRMGLARNTFHAILYGSQSLGRVGLRSFYDEQGSSQMELVLKHSRSSTMVTTQLHIALAWRQRYAGISTPILEFPAKTLPHLVSSFFTSLRTYPASTKSVLILENSHVTPLQQIGDFHLMDRALQSSQFTSRQIRQINYCRLFLQVQTVSDLATALGTHIDISLFSGQPSLLFSGSPSGMILYRRRMIEGQLYRGTGGHTRWHGR